MLLRLAGCWRASLAIALAALGILAGPLVASRAGGEGNELVVYSARKYQLVEELFREYGKMRGIEVKFVTDDGALLAR